MWNSHFTGSSVFLVVKYGNPPLEATWKDLNFNLRSMGALRRLLKGEWHSQLCAVENCTGCIQRQAQRQEGSFEDTLSSPWQTPITQGAHINQVCCCLSHSQPKKPGCPLNRHWAPTMYQVLSGGWKITWQVTWPPPASQTGLLDLESPVMP